MARKTAATAAAPSPDEKEKAGATKPAAAAKPAAKAPAKAVVAPASAEAPATKPKEGDEDQTDTAGEGVVVPPAVAAAVLALATAGEKGPDEDGELSGDDLPEDGVDDIAGADGGAFVFALPVLTEFPAVLTLTNAWPGRHEVAGTNETLNPGETREVEFTEKGFARFSKQITQLADLHGWTEGQGILIEQGEDNAED